MAGEFVKDGTDQTFAQDVIEASKENLVLVDFWAPWCGPCRNLGPAIERVVNGFNGAVKLVKVNVDQNPHFSGQLRVQSIPAVFAFKDGQPIDGFMGALPEGQIKAFVEKHIGAPKTGGVQPFIDAAFESLKLGDIGGAAQSFAQVLQIDAQNQIALAGLARCYLKSGNIEQAQDLADQLPQSNDAEILSLRALLALTKGAQEAGEIKEIKAKIDSAPENLMHKYELAQAYIKNGDFEEAIEALFAIMKVDLDWNEKSARHLLLRIFDAMGQASDLTKAGRRRLSTLLFS